MAEELITASLSQFIDAGMLAGAATLVWQEGKVIQAGGVGWRDADFQSAR